MPAAGPDPKAVLQKQAQLKTGVRHRWSLCQGQDFTRSKAQWSAGSKAWLGHLSPRPASAEHWGWGQRWSWCQGGYFTQPRMHVHARSRAWHGKLISRNWLSQKLKVRTEMVLMSRGRLLLKLETIYMLEAGEGQPQKLKEDELKSCKLLSGIFV